MQNEFVNLCRYRVFKDIGGLMGWKSLATNWWTPIKDKLSILVKERNLVEKNMKTGQNII